MAPPRPITKSLGSRVWQAAVGESVLAKREKALCNALLVFADWDTGECEVSMERLARTSSWSPRAMQKAATAMAKCGALHFPRGRNGGLRPNGEGIACFMRLDLSVLRSLRGAPQGPPKGAPEGPQGRTGRSEGAHAGVQKGARRAPKQPSIQPEEETTTTTTIDAAGGGGGGCAGAAGGEPGGGEPETTAAEKATETDESRAYSILTEFGVSVGKARKLAGAFSPAVVQAGINWVRTHASNMHSQPAALVIALEDGSAELHEKRLAAQCAADERRGAEAELVERRARQIEAIQIAIADAKRNARPSQQARVEQAIRNIRTAWPDIHEIVEEDILSDDMVGPDMNPVAVFKVLAGDAKAVLIERGQYTAPPDAQPVDCAQPERDRLASGDIPASGVVPPDAAAEGGR